MIGPARLAGLVLGAAGFLGMDFVASSLLVAKYGSREGSASIREPIGRSEWQTVEDMRLRYRVQVNR